MTDLLGPITNRAGASTASDLISGIGNFSSNIEAEELAQDAVEQILDAKAAGGIITPTDDSSGSDIGADGAVDGADNADGAADGADNADGSSSDGSGVYDSSNTGATDAVSATTAPSTVTSEQSGQSKGPLIIAGLVGAAAMAGVAVAVAAALVYRRKRRAAVAVQPVAIDPTSDSAASVVAAARDGKTYHTSVQPLHL